jgi:hypothetical protein
LSPLDLADRPGRASLHRYDRIEFAVLQHFIGDALFDEGVDRLDAQPYSKIICRYSKIV